MPTARQAEPDEGGPKVERLAYSREEVAEALGISRRLVYDLLRTGSARQGTGACWGGGRSRHSLPHTSNSTDSDGHRTCPVALFKKPS